MKKYQMYRRSLISALLLMSTITLTGCHKKEKSPPPEIVRQYQKSADLFCNAIVECFKKDVTDRLKDSPDREQLVLSRMNRDLCRKGQYSLIGKLSVDMSKSMPAQTDPSLYKTYEECAMAVAHSPDCKTRKKVHREHPACKKIRGD